MDLKKLTIGSALLASAFALSACGDDSSSGADPVNPDGTPAESSSSTGTNNGGNSATGGNTQENAATTLSCSEIMFHGLDSLEWVEFYISKGEPLASMAASELHLSGAADFDFPDEPLAVNEYVVVTNDLASFKAKYPNVAGKVYQWNEGDRLSNSGDVVSVKIRGEGDVDCSFDDDPPWPSLADGKGSSLVYVGGEHGNPGLAQNWAASKTPGGNPGSGEDPIYEPLAVRINEVNPSNGSSDWIELFNTSDKDVDVSGYEIYAKKRNTSITIPAGSVVPAGGFLVLEGEALGELVLISRGESLYLREVVGGAKTNIESGLEYPSSPYSTAGVIELSDGTWAQGSMAEATKGAANSGNLLGGPLYINEIFYNPPEGQFEFLEIVNTADTAVSLMQKVNLGSQPWEFSGLGKIENISTTVIPAKGVALLLPDTIFTMVDIESYKSQLKLGDNVVVLQYSGKISNRGERLVLKQPYECTASADVPGEFDCHYYWSDVVLYSDDGLWPREADGAGKSLKRVNYALPGSDPAAWEAATPTRGVVE